MDNDTLLRRFQIVKDQRNSVQAVYDAIEELVTPYRGRFFRDNTDENSIEWRQRQIYDSTAVSAHKMLSSTMHSGLTSPAIRWFDLRFRDENLNKLQVAKKWIQEVSDRVYHELQDSNFNLEITEAYQDLTGFGTSFMTLEPMIPEPLWDGLRFRSVPLKEAFQETDSEGQTLYFYRHLKWTATKIVHRFGTKVPDHIMEKHTKGSKERIDVLFVIFPRKSDLQETRAVDKMDRRVKPSRRPFAYRHICMASGESLGTEGGYYEMPAFGPRWETTSDSDYGHSPAMVALADIITLNESRKMQLQMAEKLIDPPILAEENAIFTDLDMRAGGMNTVRDKEGIIAFRSEGSFPISDALVNQLQAAVRNYFMVDQLLFPQPQAQPMTATEAQIRWEQMNRLLATPMGRIQNDLLVPILTRATRMLARSGQLPEAPPEVVEANAELDFEFIGSISRAQRVDRAASIERLIMTAGNMGEIMPEMLDNIDSNEAIRWIARDLNVPADVVRAKRDVEQKQKARAAQQSAMQAAEAARMVGESQQAMGQGAQAMEQGGVNEPPA